MNTATLDAASLLFLLGATGAYAMSFVSFALDLARRSADATTADASARASRVLASSSAAGATAQRRAGVATLERRGDDATAGRSRSPISLRVGLALAVLGFALHLVATILRGIAAARVPWANMYEFSMTGTLVIMGVFLGVLLVRDLKFLGTFVTGLVIILLGIATVGFRVDVVPLPPALQSYWLVIHVFVAILATAFFALGFALSVVQLLQHRREAAVAAGLDPRGGRLSFLRSLPGSEQLENLAYRLNIIGFILWTFTLMAGAIWAERAWGRYWGWDTKEVWTFIIWVIYAGYIHARATRGWRGSRSAWLAIIGFSAVLFNFGVVNVFFKGLHAYSGL
ncbi:c-type cytochrome biogenesis protein CcsB [Microbacteriaceae bacterium 4G12]